MEDLTWLYALPDLGASKLRPSTTLALSSQKKLDIKSDSQTTMYK
jgi:hypothetical protein